MGLEGACTCARYYDAHEAWRRGLLYEAWDDDGGLLASLEQVSISTLSSYRGETRLDGMRFFLKAYDVSLLTKIGASKYHIDSRMRVIGEAIKRLYNNLCPLGASPVRCLLNRGLAVPGALCRCNARSGSGERMDLLVVAMPYVEGKPLLHAYADALEGEPVGEGAGPGASSASSSARPTR